MTLSERETLKETAKELENVTKCLNKVLNGDEKNDRDDIAAEVGSILYALEECKGKLLDLIKYLVSPIKG